MITFIKTKCKAKNWAASLKFSKNNFTSIASSTYTSTNMSQKMIHLTAIGHRQMTKLRTLNLLANLNLEKT